MVGRDILDLARLWRHKQSNGKPFASEMGISVRQDSEILDSLPPEKPLSPEAQRALAEAEARRAAEKPADRPKELQGRDGPEPVRYGDWERKGLASDF